MGISVVLLVLPELGLQRNRSATTQFASQGGPNLQKEGYPLSHPIHPKVLICKMLLGFSSAILGPLGASNLCVGIT